MSLRLAVFDVDGTLIDSRSSIFRAAVEAAHAINIDPPTYDDVRAIVGVSLFDALAMMRPDLDHETIAAYTHEFQQTFLRFHAEPDFSEDLYLGAEDTALNRAFARKWLSALARRVFQPGCQFDHVLTLQGRQGLGKSSFGRALVPIEEWVTDGVTVPLTAHAPAGASSSVNVYARTLVPELL